MTESEREELSEAKAGDESFGVATVGEATAEDARVGVAPRIGIHAPIAGGLPSALLKSRELGCDAVQIFSRNPRGWQAKPLTEEEAERFRAARAETGISPVVIHCNYLVNLAAANPDILQKSRASFREEVLRGLTLGADYLVVHPGSAKGSCESDAIRVCAESIKVACDGLALGPFRILLENTAGQGECIGHRFEHLREIISCCAGLNLGVCFDTAHAFTAGYDFRDEDGLAATIEALERNVGTANVLAVHFNDSRAAYNSRVDRHWHLGLGHIGGEAPRRAPPAIGPGSLPARNSPGRNGRRRPQSGSAALFRARLKSVHEPRIIQGAAQAAEEGSQWQVRSTQPLVTPINKLEPCKGGRTPGVPTGRLLLLASSSGRALRLATG